jgi:hypothetical protein
LTNHSDPNPEPTIGYHAAGATPKIVRPEWVSILALLGMIVGSLILFCNVIVLVIDANMLTHPMQSPMKGIPPLDPLVMKFMAANAIGAVVFGGVLLGASIAALSLRPWARTVLLIWSMGFILLGMARTAGEIMYVAPATLAWVGRVQPENADYASGKMERMVLPKAIGILVLYCILPAMFLTLWNRQDVVDAFERQRAAGQDSRKSAGGI